MTGPPAIRPGAGIAPGYRVFGLLRRGEDVDVYDAWSDERDARVVVKALRPDRAGDRTARRRLLEEGRTLLRLTHPNLVRAYEVIARPAPLVVLETLTGETLGHMIDGTGPRLPISELGALGVQLTSALTYLHRNGLLHLDVKPSNIVCESEQAKLIDLGIARAPGRGRKGVGTAAYMAPEQVRGGKLTPATDVWGLGVTLYEAATRATPFGDEGARGMNGPAPRIQTHRRLPRRVAELIDACLDSDPAGRPTLAQVTGVLRTVAL